MTRVFVIGLDALIPTLVEKFAKDGTCPNFRKIIENGGFSKALPVIPAQTPENWTTIATGAYPGTHGIAVWGRHDYGEPVTEKHGDEAMSSNLCKAEYLWEAAASQGLRSVLLYFIGYPPTKDTADKVIFVDWFWRPGKYYFEICSAACYVTEEEKKHAAKQDESLITVKLEEAEGWANIPQGQDSPLETTIKVQPNAGGTGVTYHALTLKEKQGYSKLILAKEKDYSKALCVLKLGEWSPWFKETFTVQGERKVGTVRFKLVKLSRDGKQMLLYRSQVYPVSGFTHPPEISKELVEKFGPYINEAAGHLFIKKRLIDEETMVEELEYQIEWIAKAAKYLMDKYEASIYMMHWHFIDTLQHFVLGLADPQGGKYSPETAEEAWRLLRLGYKLADKLVGKFLEYLDDETYLIVVSDHGNAPNRKRYSIIKPLAEKGLIKIEEENRVKRINWAESKIYIDLTNIYVNLKSRYPNGTVEDTEYEKIRNQVIDTLRSLKDQDGEYVIALALKREHAPLIGLWGKHVGDIVFAYSPGYTWGHLTIDSGPTKVGGANHGPQIPTAETEISSNYATFIITGKNIKKGYKRPTNFLGPIHLTDIAPTISHILGIKPPRHSQGKILHDFFQDWDISQAKRPKTPLKFPTKAPITGDVTDQK